MAQDADDTLHMLRANLSEVDGNEVVTRVLAHIDLKADAATVGASLRALADKVDPRPVPAGFLPHPGHKPGCRCITSSVTGRTADVGGHPRSAVPDVHAAD